MALPTTTTTTLAEGADGYDRRRPLFEGTLPVELVSHAAPAGAANGANAATSSSREEQPLTIRVLRGTRVQGGGGGGERVLRLEVTTDASVGAMASFLYSLELGERDFPELKRDQSLLVDFAAFPAKLVEMIQGCCSPSGNDDDTATHPQFRARLDTTAPAGEQQQQLAVLSIVEATPFKELTHLALRVRPAHDGALKAYLAGRLRHTLALADEYRQGVHDAEERLARSEERARALEAAAAAAAQAHSQEVARLKAAHEGEAAAARARQEAELTSVTELRDKAVGSLQRRLEETERRRVELQELKRTHEGEIRELSRQVQGLQAALDGAQAEGKALREANVRLEAEVVGLKGERAELQRAQGMLAQQLADREEGLKGARAGQEAARAGQARAEEALALYKGNALQLQEKLEGSVAEIQRGNQIIAKLQGEGQALRQRLRAKGEALKQQERLLGERQRALDEAQHQLDVEIREGARLRGELAATGAKLEEAGRLNESNQQVITWLNKEINDLQLGRGSGLLPLPPVTYGSGGKQNVSVASAGTSGSAATYTPAYGRYSAGVHDTTASTISAASSAYLLSPIAPATAAAPASGSSKAATKKGNSGKKKAGAASEAAAAGAGATTTTPTTNSSKQKTGASTIYLDALGLADSTDSLSPLTPAAGTAH